MFSTCAAVAQDMNVSGMISDVYTGLSILCGLGTVIAVVYWLRSIGEVDEDEKEEVSFSAFFCRSPCSIWR
ncbi:hypothetical protein KGP36_07470 [Patescibacteria group bacterium]|nr:hypothetical protein [Patescibacteria group bacterium]